MKQEVINLIQAWVNASYDDMAMATLAGMSIERLAQIAGPEVAAAICEKSAQTLRAEGTLK